jgi:aminomethyltransferase
MTDEPRRTHLNSWHRKQGATMTVFSGWEMPLWYPHGAVSEHRSVVTGAGIFDTSHMSVLFIAGPNARDLLQRCFTRNLEHPAGETSPPSVSGKCLFGAFLTEQGNAVDDAVVCQLAPEAYMVTVNAGMGERVSEHLGRYAQDLVVGISNLTGKIGKFDLQGPDSGRVLARVLADPQQVLQDMGYFSFKGSFLPEWDRWKVRLTSGQPVLVSRTGYTGEFGFELFIQADDIERVWNTILDAGKDLGLLPCGLAARDSLRTGAVLPLSRQDFGPWPFINHPWHDILPFTTGEKSFTKTFVGQKVLDERDRAAHTYPFVGYDPRKASIHDAAVVLQEGHEIGVVLTCVSDMAISRHGDSIYSIASPHKPDDFQPKGLSCGFVKVRTRLEPGEQIELRDKRRILKVAIVDDIRPDRTARKPMREMIG